MIRKKILCIVVGLFLFGNLVLAKEQNRTAIIKDTAGEITEVTEFEIDLAQKYLIVNLSSWSGLVVQDEFFEIVIPVSNLISIARTGKTVMASYLWRGKQLSAEGNLIPFEMSGKSAFGDFKMNTDKIQTLSFKELPSQTTELKKRNLMINATLKLTEGSSVSVEGLERFSSYYSGRYGSNYNSFPDIPFMRGESLVTVAMKDLVKVDFDLHGAISVNLKNGTTGSGKVKDYEIDAILGFCGVCDKGIFFIDLKYVKMIDFSKGQSLPK